MLKDTYQYLLTRTLCQIAAGKGDETVENPALVFTRRAKNGDFDSWSDPEYNQSMKSVEVLSKRIWKSEPEQPWNTILRHLLRLSHLKNTNAIIDSFVQNSSYHFQPKTHAVYYDPVYDQIHYGNDEKDADDDYDAADLDLYNCDDIWPDGTVTENDNPAKLFSDRIIPYTYIDTPQDLYLSLSQHIYGQENAKRAIASFLWTHARKHVHRNLIFAGPTGSGKTELFRQASQIYPHIRIIDASKLTAEGWSGGSKIRNIFDDLSKFEAERTIYVLDEADKLFEPTYGSHGTNYSYLVQNELLRLLDGDIVTFPADEKTKQKELTLDTSHMSFALLGSFETMLSAKNASIPKPIGFGAGNKQISSDYNSIFTPDDLVTYAGVRREIAGRIHGIVQLQPMTEEDFYNILQNPSTSPVTKLEAQYGIQINIDDDSMHLLARQAEESRMGVRYMTARITEMLDQQLFKDCLNSNITLSCC